MSRSYEEMKKDYRQHAIHSIAKSFGAGAKTTPDAPSAPTEKQLKEFCIAGGHDVEELDRFLSEVSAEIATMMPT